jgi:dipeptidase E
MKIFLASEAKNPISFEKLVEFVGGSFAGKKVAYIPTAANGEGWGSWKESVSLKLLQTLEAKIQIFELENMLGQDVIQQMKDVDIIWMAGGMCGYLMYWLRRMGLDKEIPEMVNNGVIYIGSSAGSMVTSKTLYTSEMPTGDRELGASVIPGLGLVDFEIYPHYRDELKPEIEKFWKQGSLYLIKDGEAITVVDGQVEVLGEKRVIER